MDDFSMSPNLEESHGIEILSSDPNIPPRVRGKSFTLVEDEALCRSWLAATQDSIVGSNQTMAQFWDHVLDYFSTQPETEQNRTGTSLSHRWKLVQRAVNKFAGFYEQVILQSGYGEAKKISEAKRMYHRIIHKHFTFDTCWEILRLSCKWDVFRALEEKDKPRVEIPFSQTPLTPNNFVSLDPDIDLDEQVLREKPKRPMGTKAAKKLRSTKVDDDARYHDLEIKQNKIVEVLTGMSSRSIERDQLKTADRQNKAESREEQLRLLASINAREQRNEDYKIMSMDMTILDQNQRSYFEDLQQKIIARNR